MISDNVLKHVNKCLKDVNRQKRYSTKGFSYTNLEIAAFMSIIFNEKYTEEDIHNLCVATIGKIRKILNTNKELKRGLVEDMCNCKSDVPDYSFAYKRMSFESNYSEA